MKTNKTILRKHKAKSLSIDKYFSKNKLPLTEKQLFNVQKRIVNNMVRKGTSAHEIKDFVQKSNKLYRSIGAKKFTNTAKKNFRDLLNYGEVNITGGKHFFRIRATPLTQYSKWAGDKFFDKNVMKYLNKQGLLSASSIKLINLRKTKQGKFKLEDNGRLSEVRDIINSFSNPQIYIQDIKRLITDYLGLEASDELVALLMKK